MRKKKSSFLTEKTFIEIKILSSKWWNTHPLLGFIKELGK
jgi:hypothetical protein